MSLKDDLDQEVRNIFASAWQEEVSGSVPTPDQLRLNANHAKNLEKATVLYADLDGSTSMVDTYHWQFSAEVYKAYLRCAGQIIRAEQGVITAYDGDRIMAVFTGELKNTSAVRCAMKINHAVVKIIRPALKRQYPDRDFTLQHVIGIDTSQLRAARIGVRGDNDIVWIGRAANYAAKLTNLSEKSIWITKAVYESMRDDVKFTDGKNMWEARSWTSMNGHPVYCSSWYWGNV